MVTASSFTGILLLLNDDGSDEIIATASAWCGCSRHAFL